jgi:uncharacterized membrane protein
MRQLLEILGLIIVGTLGRLVPHPANVTPLTAICLFGGLKLPRMLGAVVTLCVLVISDFLLSVLKGYPGWGYFTIFNYSGFIGIIFVVERLKNKSEGITLVGYILGASLVFWLWSNLGVWAVSNLYPRTLKGFINCYYMAVPFLRNSLVGDLVWGIVIFGLARVAELGRRAGFRFQ